MKLESEYYKVRLFIIFCLLFVATIPARAQMKMNHLPADAGMQAGTQAPPSILVFIPFYNYHSSTFKDKGGNSVGNPDIDVFFTGIGGSIVTNLKLLDANWGATVLFPFSSARIEGGETTTTSSLAFTDMYIQPIQLGWHTTTG